MTYYSDWSSVTTDTLVVGFYNVELVAGPYSWNVTFGDEPDYGPTSGLWFGWEKPSTDPFGFAHPDHMEAQFGVIVADPADLVDLVEDQPVAIRVWLTEPGSPEECQWSFYGRVAEISAVPHRLGMLYTVDAVGYSVDPAEVLSGLEFWEGGGAQDRADAILAPVGATIDGLDLFPAGNPLDRDPAPAPAYTLLLDLLKGLFAARGFDDSGEHPYIALPVLHTYATDTGRGRGDGTDFAVDFLDKWVRTGTAPLPGLFGELGSGDYGLIIEGTAEHGVVDACGVLTDSTQWGRTKSDRPNRVRLEAWETVIFGVPVERVWTAARESADLVIEAAYPTATAYNSDDGQTIAEFLLPDPPAQVWAGESYRFRLSDLPDGLPQMIPNYADHADPGSEERSAMWVRPIVVDGIPSRHDPIGKGYVAGQLTAAKLSIIGGQVYVDFALNRTVPPPQPVGLSDDQDETNYLSGDDLALAPYDAVTWNDLDPGLTGYDLRLARETV